MGWLHVEVVKAGLGVMVWGMAGILATTAVMMLATMLLRRAFPPPPEPGREEGSTARGGTM